jgi:hypothetical protein
LPTVLSPRRGWLVSTLLTHGLRAVGCILAPLRGFRIALRAVARFFYETNRPIYSLRLRLAFELGKHSLCVQVINLLQYLIR